MTALSYGVNSAPPTNWNPLAAGSDQQALSPVADQVWQSVFTFGPDLNPVLNTALVQSATETSTSPQTVVYRINPKATWSDGTPVTGADFMYNWQAQSGSPGFSDKGGKPFTPATSDGYSQVQSVTVSPASTDVVTAVFSTPDPDWTELFRHLVPAHLAQQVGFDAGFSDPVGDLVSDGPYLVASYDPSGVAHLVRNPSYDGPPAAALELDVHYLPDPEQLVSALSAGQISCAEVPATAGAVAGLKAGGALTVTIAPGPGYLDLVFNAAAAPSRTAEKRADVIRSVSRGTVISDALAGVDPQSQPVSNRFLVPGEAGYASNTAPTAPPGRSSPTTVRPSTALRLAVTSSDPTALAAGEEVVQQLDAAGYTVTLSQTDDITKLAAGSWDLALITRQFTPWPDQDLAAYQSGDPANLGQVSDPALDQAVSAAATALTSQRPNLVDQADIAAWQASADLPLLSLPQVFACQPDVTGAGPNGSPDGPAYNAAAWGLSGGSS